MKTSIVEAIFVFNALAMLPMARARGGWGSVGVGGWLSQAAANVNRSSDVICASPLMSITKCSVGVGVGVMVGVGVGVIVGVGVDATFK